MSLTGKEVAQMHKDYVMQSWARSGADTLPVERAEGIYFYDYDGKKYADMASLLVCSNLGHELPEIVEAIKEQADKMCFMAPAYASEPKSMLAKMLVEAAGADTYSGHTLACAAGVAAMKYYKEHDIEGHVAEMHEIVAPFMDEMVKKHKCIGEARCIGLFGALEVVKNKETREPMQEYGVPGPVMPWIFAELKKRGFATFGRENFIEICPPLIITKEELEEYLPILDEVLTMVDEKFCD